MDFHQLEVLEEKIKKMLSTMKALQSENQQLSRKCDESEKAVHKLKQDLARSSRSSEGHESLQEQVSTLKRERDEIKNKVEGLISHIEELEAKI
jgi:predicted RNase H-like nuclease (RuvC/YqgF family)